MPTDPWFYAVALPAVTLFGLSKGGFTGVGLLSMPLMSLVMPPVQAAAIMLPVLLVQDVVSVWNWRQDWDGRILAYTLPGALLGIVIGWLTASMVDDAHVRLLVGVIAVAFGLNGLVGRKRTQSPAAHSIASGAVLGTLAGYTSFVIHVGGPPFNVYAVARRPTKEALAATAAMLFAVLNAAKLPAYLSLGQLTSASLAASTVLLPMAIAANIAGVWLVRRISAERFFHLVFAVTLLVGLKLVADGARAIAG